MPQQSPDETVQVVRHPLGTPDAVIVETAAGVVVVVADPDVPTEKLDAVVLAAQHLPHVIDVLPEAFLPALH